MLFSSPDYPVFLIAVFFLYALARWGHPAHAWARIAVMVLLGDVVFMLVAKDASRLWDPIGGPLLHLAAGGELSWSVGQVARWLVGGALLVGAIALGQRRAGWIASERGQARIALGAVIGLVVIGGALIAAARAHAIDALTAAIVDHGHLLVLALLGVAVGVSRTERHRQLGRVSVLFVASSLFYHAWAAAMPGAYRYLLGLLLATIVLDYYLALWIERATSQRRRKALLIVSLCSNLGVLVFFKYADFFTHDVLQLAVPRLELILPAGISFHTFQSLSYTIDVYRRELPATRSVVQFATFVLFFPQLVAGPIVRAHDLLPQLGAPPPLELDRATRGLFRILVGLFKKIALADALAIAIVDRVFEAPERFSAVEVMAGVYGYALQIYLDFSAYSDIAIGSAMVLGLTLPENFRTPYRSVDLQELWRRWHISLSTWLRDYLYIALGGNRRGAARTYANLILTMLLGGLWHGASWTFVVWGGLHGAGLAMTRYVHDAGARGVARLGALCAGGAVAGYLVQRYAVGEVSPWAHVAIAWLWATPLWAVATAWLGRAPVPPAPADPAPDTGGRRRRLVEGLRIAMCAAGALVLVALKYGDADEWLPLVALTWALALAADVIEAGTHALGRRALAMARRALAATLVFHYVCFAWIFFRAPSFDGALAVLRQIAAGETDHANVGPIVTTALLVGFACHYFAEGSFAWLRDRFLALPAYGQGAVLAAAALVLRELSHPKLVPFIYFQF
jgi:D-alanyl-lipoteichoic acid acyltransferase DltB (MBOAT superfamily)